jgi:hypothetical protein
VSEIKNALGAVERSRVAKKTKLHAESSAAVAVVKASRVVALDKVAADAAIEKNKLDEERCAFCRWSPL